MATPGMSSRVDGGWPTFTPCPIVLATTVFALSVNCADKSVDWNSTCTSIETMPRFVNKPKNGSMQRRQLASTPQWMQTQISIREGEGTKTRRIVPPVNTISRHRPMTVILLVTALRTDHLAPRNPIQCPLENPSHSSIGVHQRGLHSPVHFFSRRNASFPRDPILSRTHHCHPLNPSLRQHYHQRAILIHLPSSNRAILNCHIPWSMWSLIGISQCITG